MDGNRFRNASNQLNRKFWVNEERIRERLEREPFGPFEINAEGNIVGFFEFLRRDDDLLDSRNSPDEQIYDDYDLDDGTVERTVYGFSTPSDVSESEEDDEDNMAADVFENEENMEDMFDEELLEEGEEIGEGSEPQDEEDAELECTIEIAKEAGLEWGIIMSDEEAQMYVKLYNSEKALAKGGIIGNDDETMVDEEEEASLAEDEFLKKQFPTKPFYFMSDKKVIDFIMRNFRQDEFYIRYDSKPVFDFLGFLEMYKDDPLTRFQFIPRTPVNSQVETPETQATSETPREKTKEQRMLDYELEMRPNKSPTRNFPDQPYYWMNDIETIKFIRAHFAPDMFYVTSDGKIIDDFEQFVEENSGRHLIKYSFHMRLRAGKGGFGSLLRSFRVNKSTNQLMMRDLNGRRLASVDEENKLRRYLEKQARKEQDNREKRNAKLAKLTAPAPKHQFEDQDYIRKRDEILESTEDACEAGFAYLRELRKKEVEARKSKENQEESENESDVGEDVTDINDLFSHRGGRKRKVEAPTIGGDELEKRVKRDYEDDEDSENDSENEPDDEELEAIRAYFDQKKKDDEGESSGTTSATTTNTSSIDSVDESNGSAGDENGKEEEKPKERKRIDSATNVDDIPKIDDNTPCTYGSIDLKDFKDAEELELLGLEHLKSALTERGLKCGGSLSERAARLWQVKGLATRQWPKGIMTPELKKKIVEEEAEEKKNKKKNKKQKK